MPDEYVVDTNVISYLFRDDSRAELFRPYLPQSLLAVSFMTVAELDRWALHHGWGRARRERMAQFLNGYTLINVDRALCRIWAAVSDEARRAGRPIDIADAWIAATAIALNVPLLTLNRADFAGVSGLIVLPE
jgi:predicted nucleic acid-binding protein